MFLVLLWIDCDVTSTPLKSMIALSSNLKVWVCALAIFRLVYACCRCSYYFPNRVLVYADRGGLHIMSICMKEILKVLVNAIECKRGLCC